MVETFIVQQHDGPPCNLGIGTPNEHKSGPDSTCVVCIPDSRGRSICVHATGDVTGMAPAELMRVTLEVVVRAIQCEKFARSLSPGREEQVELAESATEDDVWLFEHGTHNHPAVQQTGGACNPPIHHPSCEISFPSSLGWTEPPGNCVGSGSDYSCTHVMYRPPQ